MQEGGQAFLSGLAHCSLLSGPSDSDALTLIITYCAGCRFNDVPTGRTMREAMPLLTPAEEAYRPSRVTPAAVADRGLVAQPRSAGPGRSSKPSKVKAGVTVAPTEREAPEGTRRLPDAGLHDELRHLTRRHIGPEHAHVATPVRPFTAELEGIAGVEVPQLGGVDAVRGRDLSCEQQVVDGAAGGPLPGGGRRLPGAAVPAALGMGSEIEGGDERFAGTHRPSLPS